MAQVLKARRIANPGRRRKRNPRKLSAKQIKYFGTKRQRAALARRKNPSIRKTVKVAKRATRSALRGAGFSKRAARQHTKGSKFWSGGTRKSVFKRKRKVRNVGAIYTVTLGGNPGKKEKKSMARSRKASHRRRSHRRRNPRYVGRIKRGVYKYANPRRRRRHVSNHRRRRYARRNPGRRYARLRCYRRNPGLGSATNLVKSSLYIIAGAVGTRSLTQMVLKDKNTGVMGYVANAVGSFILGFAASKVFKSKEIGTMVTVGGMTGLVLRILQDVTPIGQYVNLQLSGMGMLGDVGMGAIVPTTFFVPLYTAHGQDSIANTQLPAAVLAAMTPPAKAGMKGVGVIQKGGRYTSTGRYSS